MGTRFYGEITIPTHLIDEGVEEAIDLEGFSEREENDGLTNLVSPEARYGQFEDLEQYLVKRKIPFDRESEACMEFEAETVFYRPEMQEEPLTIGVTSPDGNFYIVADLLKPLLDLEPSEAMDRLKAMLDEQAPEIKPIYEYI